MGAYSFAAHNGSGNAYGVYAYADNNGIGIYEFDYTVKGLRLGYEEHEPLIDNVDYVPFQGNQADLDETETTTQEWYDSQLAGVKKILKKNGTLDKNGKVNEKTFKDKGWKLVKDKKEK